MPKQYRAYVCSETHWDREWYGTFQNYRIRLVKLMDRLLEVLEEDPDYKVFNFDGQTIVLEDYLEIRPENRERLEWHIQNGRITVGPWYILPDEFCVGGEAHIRNLLRGAKVCQQFGGGSTTGYLPDMFGHISQMPQILRGFGIDNALLWRGLSGDEYKNELWWEAPDGTKVFAWHILEYCGYCNAALFPASLPPAVREKYADVPWLPDNPERAAEAMLDIAAKAAEKAQTDLLLLFNGVDHMAPQPTLPEILARANALSNDVEFIHVRFDDFTDALRAVASDSWQTVHGELKDTVWSREGSGIVLPNVLSSRVYLKQANDSCQRALERWAEPTSVLGMLLLEREYPRPFLDKAWQWLIKNHPHDSIGGCSVDPVHRQMETRFEWAQEIADAVTDENLYHLSNAIDTTALNEGEAAFVLFNPLNWDVEDTVTVAIDLEHGWLGGVNADNVQRTVRNLRVMDWQGNVVPFDMLHVENLTVNRNHLPHFAPAQGVVRVTGRLQAKLPALGYATFRVVREHKPMIKYGSLVTGARTMENEFLRVRINSNGTLDVLDKATGHEFANLGAFTDGGDNGDGYTYSPPRFDAVYDTLGERPRIALIENGPAAATFRIEYEWQLPLRLNGNRQERGTDTAPLRIVSQVILGANSRRVDIETVVENTHEDHRLRALFPTNLAVETCWAEGHFDVLERPIRIAQPDYDTWREAQPREYPQQTFCDVNDGKVGLAVLNRGLLEFAVGDNAARAISLTLLRAVKYLGADGHPNTIHGGAGPHIETPESQCKRPLRFHYAVMPHAGDWKRNEVQRQAHQHTLDWRTYFTNKHEGELSAQQSLLRLDGDHLTVSALKASEDGTGIVLRFWNSDTTPTTATLTLPDGYTHASKVDLTEQPVEELTSDVCIRVQQGRAALIVGGKKIVTVKMSQ